MFRPYQKTTIFTATITSIVVCLLIIFGGAAVLFARRGDLSAAAATFAAGSLPTPILSQDWYVTSAVKKATPAVVSILVEKEIARASRFDSRPDFFDDQNFFPNNGREEVGGGSGFLVSADGYVVTNRHVVETPGSAFFVFTNDGRRHEAETIALDPVYDIAVLKISGADFPYLELGDSDYLEVGQTLIAIGNALGEFRNTVSVGVVSGLARQIVATGETGRLEFLDEVIQTDAAINLGNSGGPLLDLAGRVIGVNVATAIGSQNIGFALPINNIRAIINSVKTSGKIIRPFLGVRYIVLTSEIKNELGLPFDYGVLITSAEENEEAVVRGSSADKAGLKEGDIILEFDGERLGNNRSLGRLIRDRLVGDEIKLKVWRDGEVSEVPVTLLSLPENISV